MKGLTRVLSAKRIGLAVGLLLAASPTAGYATSFSFSPTTSIGLLPVDGTVSGAVAIESQSGGPSGSYTMVFTFASAVTSVGGVSVTGGTGTVQSSMIDSSNSTRYIVNLTGVADAQYVTVSLTNVQAGGLKPTVSASMGILIGDTNGDGFVNSADITQVKSQSGTLVGSFNFREDVNGDGLINSADITLVKSESGTALSPLFLSGASRPDGVPIPDTGSSAALLGLALFGIVFFRWRLTSA